PRLGSLWKRNVEAFSLLGIWRTSHQSARITRTAPATMSTGASQVPSSADDAPWKGLPHGPQCPLEAPEEASSPAATIPHSTPAARRATPTIASHVLLSDPAVFFMTRPCS